jgi:hypothetical protein
MAAKSGRLSQRTFERMLELISKVKHHALARKDDELWGMADTLDALLHKFVSDMIVEGTLPNPSPRETSDKP